MVALIVRGAKHNPRYTWRIDSAVGSQHGSNISIVLRTSVRLRGLNIAVNQCLEHRYEMIADCLAAHV